MNEHEVYGLYADNWKDDLVSDAYAHPAKMARGMIRWLYQYMLDKKYLAPGDTVLDPFGGVACGALDAMQNSLHWLGIELEPRFVDLGNRNIDLWNNKFSSWYSDRWGTAVLVQGDSRLLLRVLAGAEMGGLVSRPPFRNQLPSHDNFKPPHDSTGLYDVNFEDAYGNTAGQLGTMPEGTVDSAISSPPYADAVDGKGEGPGARYDSKYHSPENSQKKSSDPGYGDEPGNLGNMKDIDFDGIVSSPPYAQSTVGSSSYEERMERLLTVPFDTLEPRWQREIRKYRRERKSTDNGQFVHQSYGDNVPGQLGEMNAGETFWSATAQIVTQCYQAMKPGGYVAWITGDFVRKKKRVEFGRQWNTLCESVGFEPVEHIFCSKIEPGPIQTGIFEDQDHTKSRVSFFRRMANNKNPDAAIEGEDVWILRKP